MFFRFIQINSVASLDLFFLLQTDLFGNNLHWLTCCKAVRICKTGCGINRQHKVLHWGRIRWQYLLVSCILNIFPFIVFNPYTFSAILSIFALLLKKPAASVSLTCLHINPRRWSLLEGERSLLVSFRRTIQLLHLFLFYKWLFGVLFKKSWLPWLQWKM